MLLGVSQETLCRTAWNHLLAVQMFLILNTCITEGFFLYSLCSYLYMKAFHGYNVWMFVFCLVLWYILIIFNVSQSLVKMKVQSH